ncbi:proline-rich receptor-like protein kinase PERK15 [Hevea brasiliensis]|uniref:proline-rich receptor-like protein kinase PERK15 n=1 Tax=Hevea brasiliensis TaxID=3981 RepID=UPI0025DEA3C3|nr:proline-rich receptor-like protein kinase PERK15 [Hevea brasiliensis]
MAFRWRANRADRRNETRDPDESSSSPEDNRSHASASESYKGIGPKPYSYGQLATATDHFSNNNLLGEGGFGQVYKGSLDGKIRAIKKLKNLPDVQSKENLETEIEVVSKVSHKNLVKLVGYCIDGANRLLVLKYFPNKSLKSKLHGKEILNWEKRMNIAKGSARGLEYLHEHHKPKIIHLDIKPDNILLDDEFEPKVADFGLALFFSDAATHISKSTIAGTQIYADPATTQSGKYSDKSDVYSFGVTLLELITGRQPIDKGSDIVNWANSHIENALSGEYENFVDSKLKTFDLEEMHRMIFCAEVCVNRPPQSRPSMKKILLALEGILPLENLCDEKTVNKLRRSITYDPKPSPKPPTVQETKYVQQRGSSNTIRGTNQVYKPTKFTYQQLSSATKDFSQKNLLYEGILGEVYVGYLNDGKLVIVKKFIDTHGGKEDEFKKIKDVSSSVHHQNLVNLIGYCDERDNRLLVYECFRFRSCLRFRLLAMDNRLGVNESPLDWPTRKGIALGIAKGLVHLHQLYKPWNIYEHFMDDSIFLDDNLEPKFAEYGRVKFVLQKEKKVTHRRKHPTLMDSKFFISSGSTTSEYVKLDVYFFGVILLKIITGKQQHNDISSTDDFNLIELSVPCLENDWPKGDDSFVDEKLEEYDKDEMDRLIECALACVKPCPQNRPQMSQVI